MHDPNQPASTGEIPETEIIGRIATPGRVGAAVLPIFGIVATPFLPFATHPTRWFGVPAVIVWMALMVVVTVVILQFIDRSIRDQAKAHGIDIEAHHGTHLDEEAHLTEGGDTA